MKSMVGESKLIIEACSTQAYVCSWHLEEI